MAGAIIDTIDGHVRGSNESMISQYPVGAIHSTSDSERPKFSKYSRDIAMLYSVGTISRAARLPLLALPTSGEKLFTKATDREAMQDSGQLEAAYCERTAGSGTIRSMHRQDRLRSLDQRCRWMRAALAGAVARAASTSLTSERSWARTARPTAEQFVRQETPIHRPFQD